MLKHGRAGIPLEVMGLMLGEFVDDYTVRVIDVFAMPQNGTVCWAEKWESAKGFRGKRRRNAVVYGRKEREVDSGRNEKENAKGEQQR